MRSSTCDSTLPNLIICHSDRGDKISAKIPSIRARPMATAPSGDDDGVAMAKSGGREDRSERFGDSTNRLMEYPGSDMTGIAGRSATLVGSNRGVVGLPTVVLREGRHGSVGDRSIQRQAHFPFRARRTCDRNHIPLQSKMRALCTPAVWLAP
ncbi:hypothetical protein LZ30DRAFT_375848 [Colletotrichum cereale]|nr:hypothetical protein LZ30DRAFT_375848 [Colletotrichum cereale]